MISEGAEIKVYPSPTPNGVTYVVYSTPDSRADEYEALLRAVGVIT